MTTTKSTNIHTAMVAAQAEFPTVGFDKANPAFRSKYASLTGIVEAVRPILNKHGCYVTHDSKLTDKGVWVQTRIVHGESGTEIVTQTELPLATDNAQKLGGALTYGRRYTLSMALGVVTDDDDDGQAASDHRPAQRTAPQRPTPPPAPPEEQFQEEEVDRYANDPAVLAKRKKANTLGASLYGQKWDDVRHANCGKLTAQRTQSIKGLTLPELDRFVDGLEKLDAKRQAAAHQQEMVQAGA
jgi:hypothetical protein